MKSIKDLWKPEVLADKLGISRDTIDRWMKEGMPYIPVGKFVFISESAFMIWIESHMVNPPDEGGSKGPLFGKKVDSKGR